MRKTQILVFCIATLFKPTFASTGTGLTYNTIFRSDILFELPFQEEGFTNDDDTLSFERGVQYYYERAYDSAQLAFEDSREQFENNSDSLRLGTTYYYLSEIFYSKGSYLQAAQMGHDALPLLADYGTPEVLSELYFLLSNIYFNRNDYRTSLDFQLLAFEQVQQLHDPDKFVYVYKNLLGLYTRLKKFDSAEYYLKKLNEFKFSEPYLNYENSILTNEASFYMDKKEYKRAENVYKQALINSQKKEDVTEQAHNHYNLGHLYRDIADYPKARVHLEKSILMSDSVSDLDLLRKAYSEVTLLYQYTGNYKKAYESHLLYEHYYEQINDTERERAIEELKTIYETEKKQQQIATLQNERELQELELTQRTWQRNFIFAIAMLIIFISIISLLLFRQKRKIALARIETERLENQQKIDKILQNQDSNTIMAMLRGQEEERKRIAADLHDQVGAMLSAVKLNYSTLQEAIHDIRAKQMFNKVGSLLDQAVQEVRRVSHNLMGGVVNESGLANALEKLKDAIEQSGKIQVRLITVGLEERLESDIELAVYKVVQELLSNTLKHAKATKFTIQINRQKEELLLTVEDNGIGYDSTNTKKGLGLDNMNHRIGAIGGKVFVDSNFGKGTLTYIEIPLNQEVYG